MMTVSNIISTAQQQFAERWREVCEMPQHERNQLGFCMAFAFAFVFSILAMAC